MAASVQVRKSNISSRLCFEHEILIPNCLKCIDLVYETGSVQVRAESMRHNHTTLIDITKISKAHLQQRKAGLQHPGIRNNEYRSALVNDVYALSVAGRPVFEHSVCRLSVRPLRGYVHAETL